MHFFSLLANHQEKALYIDIDPDKTPGGCTYTKHFTLDAGKARVLFEVNAIPTFISQ